jgi:parallel beta-helix repeat protein
LKKAVLALSLILCLSFISFLKNYKTSVKATSTTWIVNPGESIQDAINNASIGDTIFVHKGTYYENVLINKSISLIGEEKEFTIINGSGIGSVISIKGVNNVIVKGFTLMESGSIPLYSGMQIESSSSSNISDNIILNNYNGISLFNSYKTVICDNEILRNNYGISLYSSFNNLVKNNIISSNEYGIGLYLSQRNVFSANTLFNSVYGIDIALSSNNVIYHNNFDNIIQVLSIESMNVWSYGGEGNYWINYSGQDLDEDGIGDVPYVIDAAGQKDNSPLMGVFSEFYFTYKEETYQVSIISNSTVSDFRFKIGNETGNKILQFKVYGAGGTVGFCRFVFPKQFMNYPYIVLVGSEEVEPLFLNVSNEAYVYLYFKYLHENQTVMIISSQLYSELLNNYQTLQEYLYNLNVTYNNLNVTYNNLNATYYNLTDAYAELQKNLYNLNNAYNDLLNILNIILGNYTQLQDAYQTLNSSYQEHLLKYSENVDKIQNLTYIFAIATAILIIAIVYLSKRTYTGATLKRFGENE